MVQIQVNEAGGLYVHTNEWEGAMFPNYFQGGLQLGQDQESEKPRGNREERCGEGRGSTVAAVLLASTVEHLNLKLKCEMVKSL